MVVFLLHSPVLASDDAEQLSEYYLDQANGDYEEALRLISADLALMTFDVEMLEHSNEILHNSVDVLKRTIEYKEPSWTEKLTNSSFFKIVLFVGGVWLGIYAGGV